MGRHHRDHDVRIEEEGGKTSSDRNKKGNIRALLLGFKPEAI